LDLKAREEARRKKDQEIREHEAALTKMASTHAAKLFQLSASVKSPPGSPRSRAGGSYGIGNGGVHKTLRDFAMPGDNAAKRLRVKL